MSLSVYQADYKPSIFNSWMSWSNSDHSNLAVMTTLRCLDNLGKNVKYAFIQHILASDCAIQCDFRFIPILGFLILNHFYKISYIQLFLMGHRWPLFRLISSFQKNITIFTTNICYKMSIQCTVLGFEPTTFRP